MSESINEINQLKAQVFDLIVVQNNLQGQIQQAEEQKGKILEQLKKLLQDREAQEAKNAPAAQPKPSTPADPEAWLRTFRHNPWT